MFKNLIFHQQTVNNSTKEIKNAEKTKQKPAKTWKSKK